MTMSEQPAPIATDHPSTWDLLIEDFRSNYPEPVLAHLVGDARARDEHGRMSYGRPLRPHNGRDSLRDAYEEAMGLAVCLKNALIELESVEATTEAEETAKLSLGISLASHYGRALRMCVGLRSLILERDVR